MREFAIKWYSWTQAHKYREEGQGAIEYALVIGLVSVVAALALGGFASTWLSTINTYVTSKIPTS